MAKNDCMKEKTSMADKKSIFYKQIGINYKIVIFIPRVNSNLI